MSATAIEADRRAVATALGATPDTETVASFVPGPGIARLEVRFDVGEMRAALDEVRSLTSFDGDFSAQGFGAIGLTRRPGVETPTSNDLSGRYWLRADERYVEEPQEEVVDESAFTEFVPLYAQTYFTDTRGYDTALNAGLHERVHLVAAMPFDPKPGAD